MSHKKQPVKLALKRFYANKSLSDAQLNTLQARLKQGGATEAPDRIKRKFSTVKWLGSLAASLMLAFFLLGYFQTPALIASAYADIYKDAHLNNGLQPSMEQWLNENKIAGVPQQYPILMSKFCRLDQVLTTHLRIAGKEQGEMNVFIHQGERPLQWRNQSGTLQGMHWKLLQVRENLTLVVLYTDDMREAAVQHILQKMLPELEV